MIMFCMIVVGLAFLFLITAGLYQFFGWFKSFFHDFLKWHVPAPGAKQWYDGINVHSYCKYCGAEIIQDGNGNWF